MDELPPDGLPPSVTAILQDWTTGDQDALTKLMPLVFDELRVIARSFLDREVRNHTLQPTALVNEVYLRLEGRRSVKWQNRGQFFGFSAQLMRRILVDHARRNRTTKRGGGAPRIQLDDRLELPIPQDLDLVALDDALQDLAKLDTRQSQIVELHFFAGLTYAEMAETLGISASTVKRELKLARLWLRRELDRNGPAPA